MHAKKSHTPAPTNNQFGYNNHLTSTHSYGHVIEVGNFERVIITSYAILSVNI